MEDQERADAGIGRQIERGAVGEHHPDRGICRGLDQIAPIDKIADLGLTAAAVGADVEAVDRIGLDQEFYEILGLQVPHVTIPVKPGRDIARLVEVAAMDQKLKGLGQNSAVEFNTKLLNLMEPGPK